MRHRPAGQGVADGQVDQRRDLDGDVDHHVVLGHVGEQPLEVDLLLVAGAEQLRLLHPGDGQHRLMVELGVVQPVEQVDAAGPGRGQADAEPARRLGVAAGHEGGGLLVVDQDEPDSVLVAPEGLHDPVDAVAGQAEDGVDPPVDEPLDQQFCSNLRRHDTSRGSGLRATVPDAAGHRYTSFHDVRVGRADPAGGRWLCDTALVKSPTAVKVGLVAAVGVLVIFAGTDALAAHDAHGRPQDATVHVVIASCLRDAHTHLVRAVGTVVDGTSPRVSTYRFSVAFTDAGGDEEDEAVTVGPVPAAGRQPFAVSSKSAFPSPGLHCALANLNAPGDL